jgi:peptidoglycan hydrolase-like protein with peptidoglycan-binding domain
VFAARRFALLLATILAMSLATAAPAAAWSGVGWPTQNLGDRGTDVLAIQHLLRAGRPVLTDGPSRPRPVVIAINPIVAPLDGVFGQTTADAVRAYQVRTGRSPTGIVDAATWTALAQPVSLGATGSAVVALQRELVAKRGVSITVDGTFSSSTRSAVVAFQKHAGLAQTGVADAATWRSLVWHFELPQFTASSLCDYTTSNGAANWGTASAIDWLEAAGRWSVAAGYGRIAVGDVGLEHGGNIAGHETHERGLDADLRPLRKANDQCTWGTRWTYATYDRAATRALVKAIRSIAPGHVKLVYFNDPVLISEGLTTWYTGHEDHLHIRFCEATHPVPLYDC